MSDKIIKFLTCGNVDDGKSTLIGRLLHDTDSLFDDQIDEVRKTTAAISAEGEFVKNNEGGEDLDFSLFLDGLASERSQKITIDAAYRYFSYQGQKFIIADAPGHEQYTRNMAVAASNSDIAIILIDATKGIKTQTIRHSYITQLFGIKNVIVAVNKMDLVGFNQTVFDSICEQYKTKLVGLGFDSITFIPIAAKLGENLVERGKKIDWYQGKTVIDALIEIGNSQNEVNNEEKPLRLAVQNVIKHETKRFYQGLITSGSIKKGDKVMVYPAKEFVNITEVVRAGKSVDLAPTSASVMVQLDREIDLERGGVICDSDNSAHFVNEFQSHLIWFSNDEWKGSGSEYLIKINHNYVRGNLKKINHIVDVDTLGTFQSYSLRNNQIASASIMLSQKVAVDAFAENKNIGSFLIIEKDTNQTVACGVIDGFTTAGEKEKDPKTREQEFLHELSLLVKKYFGDKADFDFSI